MKMKKHTCRFTALLLVIVLLFCSCQSPAGTQNDASPTGGTQLNTAIGLEPGDDEEFNDFLMNCFADNVTSDSITFHYTLQNPENYGISMDEVTLGHIDLSTLDEDKKDVEALMDELHSYDFDKLSERQQIIYEVLEDRIESSIKSYDFILYSVIFSPTIGIQAQLPITMNEYTFYSKQDIDDYILLLKELKNYFSELLAVEKAKSEAGLFMADYTVDAIVSQCEAFIKNPEENLLIDIFDDKLDTEMPDLTEEERENYIKLNHDTVISEVIPAYEMIIEELNALKGTGVNDAGIAQFEQGKTYYEYLAREATGSSKTVDEMIEMTNKALRQDITLIGMLIAKDSSLYDRLDSFQLETDDPASILNNLQTAILDSFPEPVSKTFNIKYVHESMEEDLSPAFYMIPAIDAKDSNTIYINNYHNDDQDSATFFSTLAHEGYPGHLYQQTWFQSTNPHPIYGVLNYLGYSEGWATYVEQQSYAWSGADDNLAQALKADLDFSLGISARIDMGVNYEGWSREDTADYLASFGIADDELTNNLFEYVVAEPTNYLSYYIGGHEFWELREEAEKQLGDSFDTVAFHEFILTLGPAPFDVIREHMNTWISDLKQNTPESEPAAA